MFLTIALSFSAAFSPASEFLTPFRVKADGAYIEAAGEHRGHTAPVYDDIDGDGVKELLVGQFGDGKIRLYKNHGTNANPEFKSFEWMQAGGSAMAVPCG